MERLVISKRNGDFGGCRVGGEFPQGVQLKRYCREKVQISLTPKVEFRFPPLMFSIGEVFPRHPKRARYCDRYSSCFDNQIKEILVAFDEMHK